MQEEELRKTKKKIEKGVIATATAASVLVAGSFDSPQDLINDPRYKPKSAIEKMASEEDDRRKLKQKTLLKEKLREHIYRIPVKIRTYVCVPLWFFGTFLISLTDLLIKTVLMPLSHVLLNFALHVLILLAIVGICVKILFPDLPWSKIFNRRTLILIFAGSAVLSLCDIIMPMIWDQYRLYRNISKLIIGLIVLAIVLRPFIKKKLEGPPAYDIIYDTEALG